jgi:hypothetical protein
MKFRCAHCGKTAEKPTGEINRARNEGRKLYCGRRCFGLAQRKHKTKAQRKEEKRLYDIVYRASNLERMHDLKENNITPNRADAIASQAREILRTVNTQLRIASAGRRGVPESIVKFSED